MNITNEVMVGVYGEGEGAPKEKGRVSTENAERMRKVQVRCRNGAK